MNIDNINIQINKSKKDFKIVYDIFCLYFLDSLNEKNRDKTIKLMTPDEANKTISWINNHALPFYESLEEFERCNQLQKAITLLKENLELK